MPRETQACAGRELERKDGGVDTPVVDERRSKDCRQERDAVAGGNAMGDEEGGRSMSLSLQGGSCIPLPHAPAAGFVLLVLRPKGRHEQSRRGWEERHEIGRGRRANGRQEPDRDSVEWRWCRVLGEVGDVCFAVCLEKAGWNVEGSHHNSRD